MHTAQSFREAVNSRENPKNVLVERLLGVSAEFDAQASPPWLPAVTLPAALAPTAHDFANSKFALSLTSRNAHGAEIYLLREHRPEDIRDWGVWYGSESRIAADGREWRASLPRHVVDDFGNLVAVPA